MNYKLHVCVVGAIAVFNLHAFATDNIIELEEIEVIGSKPVKTTTNLTAATKTDTPIKDIPQSIQVVPQSIIQEQNPQSLGEILRNVSGFSQMRTGPEAFRSFKLRGFDVSDTTTDGIRNTDSLNIQPDGMANIERVEVLKGPTASINGSGAIGGTVNIVTKKPTKETIRNINAGLGMFDYRQIGVDLGGAANEDGSLRYRLVADHRNTNSYIDRVGYEFTQVAPSIALDVADGSTLTLQVDLRERRGERYIGLPLTGTILSTNQIKISRDRFLSDPALGETVNQGAQTSLIWDHKFADDLVGRAALRYTRNTFDQPTGTPTSDVNLATNTITRRYDRFDEVEKEVAGDAYLTKKINLVDMEHKVTIGADFSRWEYDSKWFIGSLSAVNVLNPTYGAQPTGIFLADDTLDKISTYGIYLQDQIALSQSVKALVGLRYDNIDSKAISKVFNTNGDRSDSNLNPRIGLVYELNPAVSLFASYSRAMRANAFQSFASATGSPFAPQKGNQYEVGTKLNFGNTLQGTISYFDLTQKNVLTADPNNAFLQIPVGEQNSRGVEVDMTWEPIQNLQLLASYAYTDAEVKKDNSIPSGNQLKNVPLHSGRLWGTYRWQLGAGVAGVGAGLTYSDDVAGDITNTFTVPSWTVMDAALYYDIGKVRTQLNITNLTDKEYFQRAAFNRNQGVVPGEARRAILSVNYSF